MADPRAGVMLEVAGLRKTYGGIVALDGVDLVLNGGEVHGLCGENGAGKSTLVKILGGLVAPDEGRVEVAGNVLRFGQRTDPRLISIVHQELSVVPDLSVLDNVLLGDSRVGALYRRGRFAAEVRARIDALGLAHVDLHQMARELTLAERQLVEIARGVARGARVLILDEPTATLSDTEIRRVFEAVRWLRGQGAAVVFISHRLPEVYALTDRITVFRNGRRVLTEDTRSLPADELVRAMIGRDVERHAGRAAAAGRSGQPPRLALQGFAVAPQLEPLDLAVPAGQILAVIGQLGSGADLLVEALAGLRPAQGRLSLDGAPASVRTPREAIARGIAYVPEDRAGKGVFLDAPVATNITVSILDRLAPGGLLRRADERRTARELALRFAIDPRRLASEVAQLSGGNQQKVALAKAAALRPRLLVLNEPTRGVDIGARAEIYKRLRAMAAEGLAIVFFSTDLEEVLELADRVVTVFRGAVVGDRGIEAASMDGILDDITRGPAAAGRTAA